MGFAEFFVIFYRDDPEAIFQVSMAEPTAYSIEWRERILTIAMKEFHQRGLRAVKMDDIAKKLGISKRTLYEIFADKETLLFECVKYCCEKEHEEIMARKADTRVDIMDQLIDYTRIRISYMTDASPTFFSELRRYGRVVDYLQENRKQQRQDGAYFIHAAQKDGYIRSDIDMELLGKIFDLTVSAIMQAELYKQFDIHHIFQNFLFVWVRGISTEKGIKKIDRIIDQTRSANDFSSTTINIKI